MQIFNKIRLKAAVSGLFTGLAMVAEAAAADLRVPAQYATIQAAVDAAKTNDIIRVAPGVYTEQVIIVSNKLSLIGEPGTILRTTKQMKAWTPELGLGLNANPHVPLIGVLLSDATFRGLTFEGERLADYFVGPGFADMVGLLAFRSSMDVENCAFYGFRETTPGPEQASSIWCTTFHIDDVMARVVGCTIVDCYEGIFLSAGPDRQSITAIIENNTIVGTGTHGGEQFRTGIYIGQGVGGRVAGNAISGFSYVGSRDPFPVAIGIYAANEANFPEFGPLQPLVVEGNTLRDNQQHLVLLKADASLVRNNRFQGTAAGVLPLGLAFSGANATIAANQFADMPEGIRLFGDDPDFGQIFGSAKDTIVSENRFCRVAKPINQQRLSTPKVTGTVIDACTTPELSIAPAVLVALPVEADGRTVESAANADGPWTPATSIRFTQDGRQNIAVPSSGAHQFFRLR